MKKAVALIVSAITLFLCSLAASAQPPQNSGLSNYGPDAAPGLAVQGVAGSEVLPASGSKASKRRLFHRKKKVPASETTGQ